MGKIHNKGGFLVNVAQKFSKNASIILPNVHAKCDLEQELKQVLEI